MLIIRVGLTEPYLLLHCFIWKAPRAFGDGSWNLTMREHPHSIGTRA